MGGIDEDACSILCSDLRLSALAFRYSATFRTALRFGPMVARSYIQDSMFLSYTGLASRSFGSLCMCL